MRLFQGEARGSGGVFAYHRLKSTWDINSASRVLNTAGQKTSFITDAAWTRVLGGKRVVVTDGIEGWDSHRFSRGKRGNDTVLIEQWKETRDGATVTYKLSVVIPRWLPDPKSPVVYFGEFTAYLEATYAKPRKNLSRQLANGQANLSSRSRPTRSSC